MPITIEPLVVRRAVAEVAAAEPDAACDVEHLIDVLGGRDHHAQPLELSRREVQLFLWYALPRKYLTTVDHRHRLTAALARFFDALGEPAADYAALCRAPGTAEALDAYDRDPDAGLEVMRRLLDESGLEPPDMPALTWSPIMGLEEFGEHERVALLLEAAIDDGRLVRGSRDFARRRMTLAQEHLCTARTDLHGCTPIEVIEAERLERFVGRGGAQRRALVEQVADELRVAAAPSGDEATFEPLRWLLRHAEAGLPLTQTGALARAVVREGAARFPGWWREDIHGPPHRHASRDPRRGMALRGRAARRATTDSTPPSTSSPARPCWPRPSRRGVGWALGGLLIVARALGLIRRDLLSDSIEVTPDGRAALRYALRRRAVAPASR